MAIPDGTAKDPVAKSRNAVQAAKAKLDVANEARATALANLAEGIGDSVTLDRAEKALYDARVGHARAVAILKHFEEKAQSNEFKVQQDALAARWERALKLSEKRDSLVRKYAVAAQDLADVCAALQSTTGELAAMIPQVIDHDGAMLRDISVEIAIRSDLARRGLAWAISSPWGRVSQPYVEQSFEGVTDLIKSWRQ